MNCTVNLVLVGKKVINLNCHFQGKLDYKHAGTNTVCLQRPGQVVPLGSTVSPLHFCKTCTDKGCSKAFVNLYGIHTGPHQSLELMPVLKNRAYRGLQRKQGLYLLLNKPQTVEQL